MQGKVYDARGFSQNALSGRRLTSKMTLWHAVNDRVSNFPMALSVFPSRLQQPAYATRLPFQLLGWLPVCLLLSGFLTP